MQCGSGTGDTVTLGCFASGFSPSSLTFAWNKVNGPALTDFIQYPPVRKGDFYTGVSNIRVSRQDWEAKDATFRCAATHAAGPVEVTIQRPNVVIKLPTLKVLASSDEDTEVSFSCLANDFSPNDYDIKWLKNNQEVTNQIFEMKTITPEGRKDANGTTLYSATSFLMLPSSEWTDGTELTCQFKGKGPTFKNSSLTYKVTDTTGVGCPESDVEVTIEGPTMEQMFLSRKGTVKCNVKVNKPSVHKISWENQDKQAIAGASKFPPRGSKEISLPLDIDYDEWSRGTKFYCVVEKNDWFEPRKTPYERIPGGETQRPSVFMLPPLEHTRKEMVTLTCYVKDFFPREVFVSWLVDDEEADSKYKFHTTNPVENQGSFSAYGQLSFSLEQWQKNDVAYSCVVHHESVANTTKAIVRSIGYRSFQSINLVNLNMNVPETCKAQ
uniref:Ig-like domain-containing protein n=1 Tax=Gasterosteus aculeatus aculeatus TaxID=481459 RepID=G3PH18_GASAC